jgi:L-iditol 2-dehydrogenase
VDLIGVFRYTSESYQRAIEILSNREEGYPEFWSLITHRFKGFGDIKRAFDTAGKSTDEGGELVLKVMIDFDDV